MRKKFSYHACCHHVYELIVKAVWKAIFGEKTTGPENSHFNQLKTKWSLIDKNKSFKQISAPDILQSQAEQAAEKLKKMLKTKGSQFRADYRQCAKNALAMFEKNLSNEGEVIHYKPGATHSARWMGTVLYCQKMFMWADQMGYDEDIVCKLERMDRFLNVFFVPAWLECSKGSDAAVNDLQFIHQMHDFKTLDPTVAAAALQKIQKHSWYFEEETAVYALFSDHPYMTDERKLALAEQLLQHPIPGEFRIGIPKEPKVVTKDTDLVDFIGPNSWFLFQMFQTDGSWLKEDPSLWNTLQIYQDIRKHVHSVKVINDAAERGVKLITNFAAIITDNDEQRSSLLQAVEKQRHDFPDFSKTTLSR